MDVSYNLIYEKYGGDLLTAEHIHEAGLHCYDLIFTTEESQPYYLLCLQCGKIVEVKNPIFKDMDQDLVYECEFKMMTYQLTFHGLCINCQKK